jgi:hypothetical protein
MTLTGWAADDAEELLAPLGDRWAHVQGVVRQAERVAAILPAEEGEALVAAACLRDLGYAPALTYCDMTSGPAGDVITYEERLAGVEERYGAEHVVARSVRQARSEVERSPAFVEGRLGEVAASSCRNRQRVPRWRLG